ncbi:hypothetical protein GGF46_002472 [Coemansia sp. RSA 552]|nr:hypothetical protein GGF46_002472 [Coemansia sp. RSA 552]
MSLNALPFPATNRELPESISRALNELNGPLRDSSNARYELATPLERGPYAACLLCGESFGMFRHKHNCINCGQVVCSDCLTDRWYLPKYGLKDPVACCRACTRHLHLSIKSRTELMQFPTRELRAYLLSFGLYNPNTMIEKSDLVAAIYNSSPMPQASEQYYRRSLPRPSQSARTERRQQGRNGPVSRDSSSGTANWNRLFTNIGNDIGRGLDSLGQQLGSAIDHDANHFNARPNRASDLHTPSPYPMPGAAGSPYDYDSRTYAHSYSRAQQQPPPWQQQQPAPPRPRSAQGHSSRPTASPQTNGNRQNTPARSPNTTSINIPDLKALVHDETDVGTLGVRVLKGLLAKHHVDYSNIVEKQELVRRVQRLVDNTRSEMNLAEETAAASDSGGQASDDNLCKVCWDAPTNCVFLNCGHMCTCLECGDKIKLGRRECPICREYIDRVVHVFRA